MGAWPAPPAPQMPPYLVNYQAWLAAQGLTIQDGIVPENNISDSAAQAWKDSITISDNSSIDQDDSALVAVDSTALHMISNSNVAAFETITVSVGVHISGL